MVVEIINFKILYYTIENTLICMNVDTECEKLAEKKDMRTTMDLGIEVRSLNVLQLVPPVNNTASEPPTILKGQGSNSDETSTGRPWSFVPLGLLKEDSKMVVEHRKN